MRAVRLAMAQMNATVGDMEGNLRKILEYIEWARARGASILLFPELALCGYPPEDLLLKPDFIDMNLRILDEVRRASRDLVTIIGYPDRDDYDIYNAAAIIQNGTILGSYRKQYLPNYGVFDENRYFGTGELNPIWDFGGDLVGVSICEDIWYPSGPAQWQAQAGAELLANISASPYYQGKGHVRERMLATRAADNVAIVAYCNLVGGQDELVFDGWSLVYGPSGELLARGPAYEEALVLADLDLNTVFRARLHDPRRRKERDAAEEWSDLTPRFRGTALHQQHAELPTLDDSLIARELGRIEEVYEALKLGIRDYVRKNGFQKVALGLSGGIDSALTAALAADALGPENVMGVSMPSRYSSDHSKDDAQTLAERLGIRYMQLPIEKPFAAYLDALAEPFAGEDVNLAEENIQARIRGNYLMALANAFGYLVLATGNKSEAAVGYATLYGDMAGGFSPIKDVPKTLVYALSRWRNDTLGEVIPESSITKPPSAELRPGQMDQDSLPPYDILDAILERYVEEDYSVSEIVQDGFDETTTLKVIRMVDNNEFKRRQAAPGIKITTRAFGKDRRLPITNRWRPGWALPK
ncbi:MAG: NAD+ synthase [Ardenticatenales bacterium]|nr:NAD+ synthase [Ardenticatenales bacterium]